MHAYAFFMHGAIAQTSQRAIKPAHKPVSAQASRLHSNTLPPACHIQIDYSSLNCLILRIFVQNRVSGQMLRIKGSHTRIYAPKKRTEYHIMEYPGAKIVNTFKLLTPAMTSPP